MKALLTALMALLHLLSPHPVHNFGSPSVTSTSTFSISGNTWSQTASSSLPSAGDDTASFAMTQPKLTLSKYSGEASISFLYQGIPSVTSGSYATSTGVISWSSGSQTMTINQVISSTTDPSLVDGGYEISIKFTSKPATSTFNFLVTNPQNFTFYRQEPLWKDEGLSSATTSCSDTDCTLHGHQRRPADIVGSYAIYYNKTNHIIGGINYGDGKALHLKRPLFTDGNGGTSLGTLSYSTTTNILSMTIDPAVYASVSTNWNGAIFDPTVGKTTIGASSNFLGGANTAEVAVYNMAAASCTVSDQQVYLVQDAPPTTDNVKSLVYTESASKPLTLKVTGGAQAVPGTAAWVVFTASGTLSPSANYWFGEVTQSGQTDFFYDTGGANTSYFDNAQSYASPLATWTQFGNPRTRLQSNYVDCSAATIVSPVHKFIFQKNFQEVLQANKKIIFQ